MMYLSGKPASAALRTGGVLRSGRCMHVRCAAPTGKAGFGESNKKVTELGESGSYLPRTGKRRVDLSQEFKDNSPPAPVAAAPVATGLTADFKPVGNVATAFTGGKPTKVVDLAGYGAIVLYLHKGNVYASIVQSTAYSFPLVDAKVMDGENGEAIVESPLDGTQYDLLTGKVIKWCPGGNPLRGILSALKKDVPSVPLVVYQTFVDELGNIFVKVTTRSNK